MIHTRRSKDTHRKFSPPGPTYMSNDQVANYLKDLRTNRPPRPSGSRPFPKKPTDELPPRASSALSTSRRSESPTKEERLAQPRSTSALSHRRTTSDAASLSSSAGRPLVQEPGKCSLGKNFSPSPKVVRTSVSPRSVYRESSHRWMEREEARSLRDALEEMDLQEEMRLHAAAQDEATQLVWEHQYPGVPYKNPHAPYRNPDANRFRQHLEKGSHTRNQSLRNREYRSSLDGSPGRYHGTTTVESPDSTESPDSNHEPSSKNDPFRKKGKVNFAEPVEEGSESTGLEKSSGPKPSNSSCIFRNPEDRIYEEPDQSSDKIEQQNDSTASATSALKAKPRNSLPLSSGSRPYRSSFINKLSRLDLHEHPPTQSHNPEYTTNTPTPSTDSRTGENKVPTKNGIEIRSEEIRAATSMKLKDRSRKLPMPTAVSDRPGRPIVSFDPSWEPSEEKPKSNSPDRGSTSQGSSSASPASTPSAPAISVSEPSSIPTINLPDNHVPTIGEMEPPSEDNTGCARPLPDPKGSKNRKPAQKATSQARWYSPYTRAGVPTATCDTCSLPISGRVVTAAGSRFHPECFTCYHCGTGLECVAFYQEPEAKRAERLENASKDDEEAQALRFYCHLDFHELFSPRCKSCKTPIEGEVVIACGAEWHVGHFFCAECGDPFNAETPFVEKDGFAWCLRCHSRRTASRCMGCKQPVLEDVVVTALGGQWHDKCFVCHECGSGFGPEGRFFVRQGEPRRTAKGRIIGGPVQLAVCERCEGIRLKNQI
ncbi:hypothetical protein VTN00DRAFT_428 [Thermoascus crustaceus]|uniref:uncharacterized protein n=1 Tax=Thermoascus crustaceus TaxID=5088 RepID=UPI003743D522